MRIVPLFVIFWIFWEIKKMMETHASGPWALTVSAVVTGFSGRFGPTGRDGFCMFDSAFSLGGLSDGYGADNDKSVPPHAHSGESQLPTCSKVSLSLSVLVPETPAVETSHCYNLSFAVSLLQRSDASRMGRTVTYNVEVIKMRGLASQVTVPDPTRVMDWLAYLGPDPSRVMAMRQLQQQQQQQQRQMDRPNLAQGTTGLRIMTPFIPATLISAT